MQRFISPSAGHLPLHSLTTRLTVHHDENLTHGVGDPILFVFQMFEAERRLDNTAFVLSNIPLPTMFPTRTLFPRTD